MSISKDEIITGITEAADRMGLEAADLLELIDEVLDDCLVKTKSLREVALAKDASQIKAIAHDIKGSTINYGLVKPSALAKSIELNEPNIGQQIDSLEEILLEIKTMKLNG